MWSTANNIVWSTDALVWGTDDGRRLWGPAGGGFETDVGIGPRVVRNQNIVWSTVAADNIVWSTSDSWTVAAELILAGETP